MFKFDNAANNFCGSNRQKNISYFNIFCKNLFIIVISTKIMKRGYIVDVMRFFQFSCL
nr:MAG TPA: hypothetical protein [Caudoviricetes sp.]